MAKVLEAPATAFHPFHARVKAFGGPVRSSAVVVVQDLSAPTSEGVPERSDLFHLVALTAGDGLVHQDHRLPRIVGDAYWCQEPPWTSSYLDPPMAQVRPRIPEGHVTPWR
jgi:hypothetical protein